jgi:RNA polymerase sigma-70 factor (ECF subfamily)
MATLQARLSQGDQTAFAELYDIYADRVGHYLLVRLGTREDTADVLQETFCRLAHSRIKLEGVNDLGSYILAIARNEAARLSAGNARRRRAQKPLDGADLFYSQSSDADKLEAAEIVALAMNRLGDDLREIVELKAYSGLTFRQISQVTGLPQGTVATRYRSALSKMQSWLTRQSL